MGRSSGTLAVTMTTLVASVLVLQLLVAPTPVSSQAGVVVPLLRTLVVRATPLLAKLVRSFLKEQEKQGVMDLIWKAAEHLKNQVLGGDAVGLVVFDVSIGTSPAQVISGVLDITSELVWARCQPCRFVCWTPAFRPDESASFSKIPCSSPACPRALTDCTTDSGAGDDCAYNATLYGAGNQSMSGYFATETFTFGATSVPGIVFGCMSSSAAVKLPGGAAGLFGFGRGSLSLVSQLRLSRFSYTLASDDADGSESVIRLGDAAAPQTQRGRSTPLLASAMHPGLYYVGLSGIRVDSHDLAGIPAGTFDLRADGSGGVFLSTTLPATYLEDAAYGVLRSALASSIESQGVAPVNAQDLHRLCYTARSFAGVTAPTVTLVFDGVNATTTMELKPENYFFKDGGQVCLTVLPSTGGSLLGSLLQTGTNMIFDIGAGRLTFETP